MITRILAVLALALGLAAAPGARAQSPAPESPGDLAVEGVAKLVDALRRLLESVPQYEAPEITPEGDIIIRRRRPEPTPPPQPPEETEKATPKPEIDETRLPAAGLSPAAFGPH